MLKKLITMLTTITIIFTMVTSVFAYSNMYTPTSGIPDYSEVTGATMVTKSYENISGNPATIYTYARTAYNDSNVSYYMDLLGRNGYVLYQSTSDLSNQYYTFINFNTGLMVMINIPSYFQAEYIGVGIVITNLYY